MDPIAATPTKPQNYAALSLTYAALAATVALVAAREHDDPAPADPGELALYGAATAGLSRLIAKEKVTEWVRQPFVETPADGERRARGAGPRHVVGELLMCTRCLGSWSALSLIGLRAVAPRQARVGATLLALSYLNTLAQSVLAKQENEADGAEAAATAAAP